MKESLEIKASSQPRWLEALRDLSSPRRLVIREGQRKRMMVEMSFRATFWRDARVHALVKGYLGKLAEMDVRGRAKGDIRPDVDSGTVSLRLLGLIQPAAILGI